MFFSQLRSTVLTRNVVSLLVFLAVATRYCAAISETNSVVEIPGNKLKSDVNSFQIDASENYLNRLNLKDSVPSLTKSWRTTPIGVTAGPNGYSIKKSLSNFTTAISPTLTHPSNLKPDQAENGFNQSHLANKSRMAILEEALGPQKKPIGFVIAMSTIYILILICGLVGNISTCCVIICNNCMHTTTNYYLFSLAVSDVLSLLTGLPIELYNIIIEAYPWPFGNTICLMRTFIFETTTIASVLTILTFTFERWLHICKAMFAKKFSSSFSRALKIIVFIWILSGLLALPYTFTTGVYDNIENYPESKSCNTLETHKHFMVNVIKLSVFFLFVVPMTLISIMYVLIGITLWKSNQIRSRAKERRNILNGSFISSGGPSNLSARICKFFKQAKFTDSNTDNTGKESASLTMADGHFNSRTPVSRKASNLASDKRKESGDPSGPINNRLSVKIDVPRHMSEISIENFSQAVTHNGKFSHSLASRNRTSKEFEHISYRARQSRRDVVKMLFVVVLGFFICWAPYHSQRVMAASASEVNFKSEFMMKILEYLYYISGISIYISSTINPILYNVMSKRYRTAFINTLKMICSCSCNNKTNSAYRSSNYYLSKNSTMKFNHSNRNNSINNSRYKINSSGSTKTNAANNGAAAANNNNNMPPAQTPNNANVLNNAKTMSN